MPLTAIIVTPSVSQMLDGIATSSQPMFNEFLPIGLLVLGFIIGGLVVGMLIAGVSGAFAGLADRLWGHKDKY